MSLVNAYTPVKTKEAPLELKIVLKDDVPVAQQPRRLSYAEQKRVEVQDDEVNAIRQITLEDGKHSDDWMDYGIIFKEEEKQLLVPKSTEKKIIKRVHQNGHFSARKKKNAISKDFYMRHKDKKIEKIIISCIPGLLATRKAGKQKGYLYPMEKEVTPAFQLLTGAEIKCKQDVEILQLLQKETIEQFNEDRECLREKAKMQIQKVQDENKDTYDKKRKKSSKYEVNDIVAIKRTRTQFGPGLKLKPKFLGPYKVVKVKRNDRYDVEKLNSDTEGPYKTSSAADLMKRWPVADDD